MNIKLLLCIAMGVFVAHLAVFMIVFSVRSRQIPPPPLPPAPNFKYAQEVVVNPKTGERIRNQEITVSTKLRHELYQGRAVEDSAKQ